VAALRDGFAVAQPRGSTNARSSTISAKVFVGNLNFRTTKEELAEFLSPAGTIVDVHLPTDRESGRPRGFAFVQFSDDAAAAEAIRQFNGAELAGRRLNINEAEERPRRAGPGPRVETRPARRPTPSSPVASVNGSAAPQYLPPPPPTDFPPLDDGRERRERVDDGEEGGYDGGRHHRGKGSRRGLRARKRSL
jgi:RNA recognition motif-containing protein